MEKFNKYNVILMLMLTRLEEIGEKIWETNPKHSFLKSLFIGFILARFSGIQPDNFNFLTHWIFFTILFYILNRIGYGSEAYFNSELMQTVKIRFSSQIYQVNVLEFVVLCLGRLAQNIFKSTNRFMILIFVLISYSIVLIPNPSVDLFHFYIQALNQDFFVLLIQDVVMMELFLRLIVLFLRLSDNSDIKQYFLALF